MNVGWVVRNYMRDPDGMVAVTADPDSLYEKMTDQNLKVCERCRERKEKFGKLLLSHGDWFRCPHAPDGISLCENHYLPKGCPDKFRHLVAVRYEGKRSV